MAAENLARDNESVASTKSGQAGATRTKEIRADANTGYDSSGRSSGGAKQSEKTGVRVPTAHPAGPKAKTAE